MPTPTHISEIDRTDKCPVLEGPLRDLVTQLARQAAREYFLLQSLGDENGTQTDRRFNHRT